MTHHSKAAPKANVATESKDVTTKRVPYVDTMRSAPNPEARLRTSAPRIDADYVIYRLEEAGRTLLALPNTGPSTGLRTTRHDVVQSAVEAYGWSQVDAKLRPATPSADDISRMDEALDWIRCIALDRYVLRRIVGARALISPITDRHLFPWRRLGLLLGADHKAIQRWHGQGIDLIVASLKSRPDGPSGTYKG